MEEVTKKHTGRTATGLIFLVLFAAAVVVNVVFHNDLYNEDGWVNQAHSPAILDKLIKLIPNVLESMIVLFVTLVVLYVGCLVFNRVFRGTPRRLTIGRLVKSIYKVVVWVVAIIAVLAVWGVNVAALVAGAGVLTLVIGLGMQSLIADVVAGVFLVCDGTLQVGDTVTIDDWLGTVQEIGIRNTRLINYSGDIRVCNNSTIKVFVNKSRELSEPRIIASVSYGTDLHEVEALFKTHAEELKALMPATVEGPVYLGVDNLNASGVDLLFCAHCKEENFFQVQRDLRTVVKCFLDEHGIEIPFPQVVVHEAQEQKPAPAPKSAAKTESAPAPAPKKRGRPKKA